MIKGNFNNIECIFFYDERISQENAPEGFPFLYHVRHDEDNWVLPISIEQFVLVNFFGTLFTRKKLLFPEENYIEIDKFVMDSYYKELRISNSLLNQLFEL